MKEWRKFKEFLLYFLTADTVWPALCLSLNMINCSFWNCQFRETLLPLSSLPHGYDQSIKKSSGYRQQYSRTIFLHGYFLSQDLLPDNLGHTHKGKKITPTIISLPSITSVSLGVRTQIICHPFKNSSFIHLLLYFKTYFIIKTPQITD